jgi:DNA polymerase-3 subunit epsilon
MWRLYAKRLIALCHARYHKHAIHPWLINAWQASHSLYKQPWQKSKLLVVDIETTSLSPSDGEMVSIGWVVINNGKIQLNSAQHLYLKNMNTVGDSATIHQIRDCQLEKGLTSEQALCAFIQAATGHVLVFHHCPMDLRFLNSDSKKIFYAKLLLPVIDTLQLEKKYLDRTEQPIKNGDLTLANIRNRYHLPPYPAHNALTDAIATAELLLAQLAHKDNQLMIKHLI